MAFSNENMLKPQGKAKLLVTNTTMFKGPQFRELVKKATNELKDNIAQEKQDSWSFFSKRTQGFIKQVG